MPSVPPAVPSHTASIVQSTMASCPAVAAIFAATNGNVARSGFSLPYVQLKISLSLISSSPFDTHQEASVRRLDRTNNVTHHPSQRRQVFLRRRIARAHDEQVPNRYLLHVTAELSRQAVGAAEVACIEPMHVAGITDGDRSKARAKQVDRFDAAIGAHIEHEMLLDRLPSIGIVQTEAIHDRCATLPPRPRATPRPRRGRRWRTNR